MSVLQATADEFTETELDAFTRDGYFICRGLVPDDYLTRMKAVADRDSASRLGDIEYEAELQYPGAPSTLDSEGGHTIRRLRQAFSLDPVFSRLVKEPFMLQRLQQLLGDRVVMPLAHHNCIMTKNPLYSSDTCWHQDIRYWSFEHADLISVWIALTDESVDNGCLRLLPGTHDITVESHRLDQQLFLRPNLPRNQTWLNSAVTAELDPGDVLFFHARCFHSATRNYGSRTKCSAVFTFRNLANAPIPGTRSASLPELLLS